MITYLGVVASQRQIKLLIADVRHLVVVADERNEAATRVDRVVERPLPVNATLQFVIIKENLDACVFRLQQCQEALGLCAVFVCVGDEDVV